MDNNILNSIYIGNIKKNHNNKYKIINDTEDKNIIQTRNYILGELSSIFNGGKNLEYKDIPHYIQALEGKYFRNKMCKGGSSSCKGACNIVKKSYSKLVKKSIDEFNNPNLFKIIKGGSQYLYKKIGEKYKLSGGNPYDRIVSKLAHKIIKIDNECTQDTCKNKLRDLNLLRNKLNTAWMSSSYCSNEKNCIAALSNYIISITPNIREYKQHIDFSNSEVENNTPSPKEIIERENSRGGTSIMYNENGSYNEYDEDDDKHFNTVMRIYCGDECTIADNTDVNSTKWGITRDTEMKIKRIDDENKEWLINHWVYANNHYKINLIIILLEDAYVNNKKNNIDSNIVYIAREFILYHTCSDVISISRQSISINFYSIARNLREEPEINEILIKLKRSSINNIDEFCEIQNYNKSNFSKGGSKSLENHYIQNGGSNLTNLRNEIDQIRYPFKYTLVIDKLS